jgi:NAD(P)-dependent dehydrogenase (short-subunit alcohol dehydrogenase family)
MAMHQQKAAIVTVASQGIGAGLVEPFLKRGSRCCGRRAAASSIYQQLLLASRSRVHQQRFKIMTKGGLDAVTRALAIEYAKDGIRVNTVALGTIKTPMHRPEAYEFLNGLHPVGRMGEVKEVVDAVLFLTDATFTTGEILHVDGVAHAGKW